MPSESELVNLPCLLDIRQQVDEAVGERVSAPEMQALGGKFHPGFFSDGRVDFFGARRRQAQRGSSLP